MEFRRWFHKALLAEPIAMTPGIAELSGMIDAKLTARPIAFKDVAVTIKGFAIQSKMIPVGEFVPKIGLDVAMEALEDSARKKLSSADELSKMRSNAEYTW